MAQSLSTDKTTATPNINGVASTLLGQTLSYVCLCLSAVFSFNGVVGADDFPEVYNNDRSSDASPMSADEAAATLQLPEGFRATVFAAEPDIRNPIAVAWDDRDRLWVAENYTYSDRSQQFDLSLRDRVIILEDANKDGKADRRTVFTDKVQMLTSVELGRGGVWLMCPPRLLFIPDANRDDIPDGPSQTILDGFTVAKSNYHNFANGLRWGPDGWLYGRCGHSCPGRIGTPGTPEEERVPIDGGMWRYHPERKVVEVLCHGTVNPWGHDWDKNGELFYINTVIGHVWHVTPGAHFEESFGESLNPDVHERIDTIADHYHFDTTGSWTASRDGAANDYGGGHAHVGMMIYQGDLWPQKYQDRLFTVNMHGMRVNVERLERHGAGYTARHDPDFVISKDPFFRAIEVTRTPDGNALLVDWSDTGECHEHTGVHRTSGRIYKLISTLAADKRPAAKFAQPMCMTADGKLPEIWRSYQANQISADELRALLDDPNEHVRVWAIRLLTDFWPLDTVVGPRINTKYPDDPETRDAFVRLARTDTAGLVQITLASTLQRLPIRHRKSLAAELIKHDRYADDHCLPNLVWYGIMPIADAAPRELVDLFETCRWPKVQKWIAKSIAMRHREHPEALDQLLATAAKLPSPSQEQLIDGMLDAFDGLRQVPPPNAWPTFVRQSRSARTRGKLRELSVVFGDGRAIDELVATVHNKKAPMQTRIQALEALIEARPRSLRATCLKALSTRGLNRMAAQGLAIYNDAAIGQQLAKAYGRFHPTDRSALMEILVSRPNFAEALLDQMSAGRIAPSELSAFHARQIRGLKYPELDRKLAETWGEIRKTDAQRTKRIRDLERQLTKEKLASASLSNGRAVFNRQCASCHMLFGAGEKIGPDLTGAQRSSLDYLLENILAPSAVVGKDYRMQIVETKDGRTFNGLVVSENGQRIVLRTATEEVTVLKRDLEDVQVTRLSPMPDGLLDSLSEDEVSDLLAYLMHPNQVALPSNETPARN